MEMKLIKLPFRWNRDEKDHMEIDPVPVIRLVSVYSYNACKLKSNAKRDISTKPHTVPVYDESAINH